MNSPRHKATLSTSDLLSLSVWAQTDALLGRALLDAFRLCDRLSEANVEGGRASEALEAEGLMVFQSIGEAAALRGLYLFGAKGERCPFDPQRHELAALSASRSKSAPKTIAIEFPGLLRREGGAEQILSRAIARRVKDKVTDSAKKDIKNSRSPGERKR